MSLGKKKKRRAKLEKSAKEIKALDRSQPSVRQIFDMKFFHLNTHISRVIPSSTFIICMKLPKLALQAGI